MDTVVARKTIYDKARFYERRYRTSGMNGIGGCRTASGKPTRCCWQGILRQPHSSSSRCSRSNSLATIRVGGVCGSSERTGVSKDVFVRSERRGRC